MSTLSHVPPGFRFHPTDEELVDYYLRKKVAVGKIDLSVIKDVDLYNIEPWDLQGNKFILAFYASILCLQYTNSTVLLILIVVGINEQNYAE